MKSIDIKTVLVGLIGLGIVFFGASWYVAQQQSEYVAQIKLLTVEQEKTLATLAQTISQDGADAVVSGLIKDCEMDNRKRFDALLSELDSLSRSELQEVDSLFDACGDFYAQRRAVMTARLQRENGVYQDYVALLKVADKRVDLTTYPVELWAELVVLEQERSDLSIELVRIQGEIITMLLDGVKPQAPEILKKASEASDVKDTLAITGIKIDEIREQVIGL